MKKRAHLLGSLAALLTLRTALAWGPEGHAIVADIAQSHLTPAAAAQVTRLLALEGHTRLDEVSSWADEVRLYRRDTGPWHYVDIPLLALAYDADRDCSEGACVVVKLVAFQTTLANPKASPQDRLEALKWVVHLVGDIHQPLHAEDHDGDKGGNDVRLTYFGKRTNLHALWDGGILEHALDLQLGPHYTFDHEAVEKDSQAIDDSVFHKTALEEWEAKPFDHVVIGWAEQSHSLARETAYGALPLNRRGPWSNAYQDEAWPVVKGQLAAAGRDLAVVLNGALQ
jgi:hypothetical protein